MRLELLSAFSPKMRDALNRLRVRLSTMTELRLSIKYSHAHLLSIVNY